MKYLTTKNLLFAVLFLAFVLRIWSVGDLDILGDEAAYAFRSVGYIDYLGTNFQTQPIDWYVNQPLPWWTKLSFHDHPPLVFLIQNLFFKIFGDSILAARLPAIIFGIASVYLIYLIFISIFRRSDVPKIEKDNIRTSDLHILKETSNIQKFGLLATFLFGISSAMVWISRTALMEPILIFLILLNIYFFFRIVRNPVLSWSKDYLPFSITLGLIVLTKYTGIFIVPVYVFYLIFTSIFRTSKVQRIRTYDVHILKDWRLYAALGLVLLIFSPVIVYNFYLYKTTGHFDLQIAYFWGQDTPEWTGLVGKTQSPFPDIGKNLADLYGIPFLAAVVIGLISSVILILRKSDFLKEVRLPKIEVILFWWLYLLFSTLLFVKVGSANRFLTLYGPVFIIFTSLAIWILWNAKIGSRLNYIFKGMVILFILAEIIFAFNKNFIKLPDYGVAKLDHYFEEEFKNKDSAVIPESDNLHLNEVIYKFAKKKSEKERSFFMIVYNDNMALPTIQWIFFRRFFYHSIPALYVENFTKALSMQGADYFKGFSIYFIQSTENTLLNPFKADKTAGLEFENNLKKQGIEPTKIIYGHNNLPMFRVYKFSF
jgi:4-amino-4-deoxy-L-arabinose transferase-like glycosyltransferase